MNNTKLNIRKWLGLFGIVLMLLAGAQVETALAQGRDKKSDKLKKKMSQTPANDYIDVIVSPTSSWSNSLTTDLNNRAAVLKKSYSSFTFKVYKIKQRDIDSITSRSDVGFLTVDDTVKTLGHVTLTSGADNIRALNGTASPLDGSGIGIVVVDSGIDPNHQSFRDGSGNSRIVYSADFTGEGITEDPYGHGTHVAGIAAGNGLLSQGEYEGIAPNAKIINLRVLNKTGTGSVSSILAALDWIYANRANAAYNMKVVNLSLGANALDSYTLDPICRAVRKLVDAGIVVVAAAGNEGRDGSGAKIYGQIHSPGNEPSAITVGAVNTFGTDVRSDDVVATYSSRGPTRSFYTDTNGVRHYDNQVKPDLVATGNKIIDAQAYQNYLVTNNPSLDANTSGNYTRKMMYLSGTSMATPATSGAVALMLQANPKLTPNLVKTLLMYTAQTINGFNTFEQGAGELNVDGAVRLARLVRQDLTSYT
ncbi:MAG: S8 family peptidase, partial [Acidobacteriota bacterium]|nr:S8 family peptidase [Acidobacteriota bacterium]